MSPSTETGNSASGAPGDLEQFRSYLRLLADVQFPQSLQQKLDPSDVVQETLIRAYEHHADFRGQSDADKAAWLRVILGNALVDQLRKFGSAKRDVTYERSVQAAIDDSAAGLEHLLAADVSTPSEHVGRDEQLCRLATALDALSIDERQAVQMHHLQGMKLAEVATALGRTKSGVASLLHRSLEKLRRAMTD